MDDRVPLCRSSNGSSWLLLPYTVLTGSTASRLDTCTTLLLMKVRVPLTAMARNVLPLSPYEPAMSTPVTFAEMSTVKLSPSWMVASSWKVYELLARKSCRSNGSPGVKLTADTIAVASCTATPEFSGSEFDTPTSVYSYAASS